MSLVCLDLEKDPSKKRESNLGMPLSKRTPWPLAQRGGQATCTRRSFFEKSVSLGTTRRHHRLDDLMERLRHECGRAVNILPFLRSPARCLGLGSPFFFFCASQLDVWGSPFFFSFCVPQLDIWGSPFFFCVPQLDLLGSPFFFLCVPQLDV